ncbi:zinc-binding dehydrogenase [Halomonas sp. THAF12]|uniref:zinc-binding dehydrogenase n=1 Tax=Halomonas sp. B23F22_10 TaxID=3459515 RepID=UPI00373F16E2
MTRAWHLALTPRGLPVAEDFVCRRASLATPAEGEALVVPHWLSVDPYMRTRMQPTGYGYLDKWRPGSPLSAWGLARVIESRGSWREGDWVIGHMPVAERCLLRPPSDEGGLPLVLPADQPRPQQWLHERGMTGFTAWLGMRRYGRPQPGESVLVSAGAGAVGGLAVQWARRAGARVVATAGSAAKRDWLRETLGVAAALDHHAPDIAPRLAASVPQGLDLDFEQLGGRVFEAAIDVLAPGGRVVLCGLVSQYHDAEPRRAPSNLGRLTRIGAGITPFVVPGHEAAHWADFQREMAALDGLLRAPLDVVEGFAAWPHAFCGLFTGDTGIGKRVVRLA